MWLHMFRWVILSHGEREGGDIDMYDVLEMKCEIAGNSNPRERHTSTTNYQHRRWYSSVHDSGTSDTATGGGGGTNRKRQTRKRNAPSATSGASPEAGAAAALAAAAPGATDEGGAFLAGAT